MGTASVRGQDEGEANDPGTTQPEHQGTASLPEVDNPALVAGPGVGATGNPMRPVRARH